MSTRPRTLHPVLPSAQGWLLHDCAASRRIEALALAAQNRLAAPSAQATSAPLLMQRAGLAAARLALAVAPAARSAWIAAGPGNNGGDGLVAARHLLAQGWSVQVNLLGEPDHLPADARWALDAARAAGVRIRPGLAELPNADAGDAPHLAIDALLGLGGSRAPAGPIAEAITRLNQSPATVLAIDVPSGLCADRGVRWGDEAVRAEHTLCLLTLKPGLFTAQGRDHAGRVWIDALGADALPSFATEAGAELTRPPMAEVRPHALHKGSFGDVVVLGGARGMGGAAVLAARAALATGAGRVFLARLDGSTEIDAAWPELMPRTPAEALSPAALADGTVVCGCGGGRAVREHLPVLLHHAARLVLDADALNALAAEPSLLQALRQRGARGWPTLLTPHPLEAARLSDALRAAESTASPHPAGVAHAMDAASIQHDRLRHARRLAQQLGCHLVLKGSGTICATPEGALRINPTGNARLATAGTGDVLAGWLGGHWSAAGGPLGHALADIVSDSVWRHGRAAELAPSARPLRAAELIAAMASLPG